MKTDPEIYKRRSIRLQGFNYSSPGAYFLTICTHRHICLFGSIENGKMRLNDNGRVVADQWQHTAIIRDEVSLDDWVVMPNHIHGILIIASRRGDRPVAHQKPVYAKGPAPKSIGAMVAGFKSAVTKRINQRRRTPGAKIWQRNYWERIVRSQPELNGLRDYIRNNPARWELDRLYKE